MGRIIAGMLAVLMMMAAAGAKADPFAACAVTGSTTIYVPDGEEWFMTDAADARRRTLPASTFKIFHSMIALDTGATQPDELFAWDGTQKEITAWNQDTRLPEAFRNSTVWVYEELARRIDVPTYRRYLGWADYAGNGMIENEQDGNFWVYGDWGVSPVEQIGMLVKLHDNALPFSRRTMDIVRGYMQDGAVYGKTGWTRQDGRHVGWWIGYTERAGTLMFFATRIQRDVGAATDGFAACRKTITETILADFVKKRVRRPGEDGAAREN